MLKIVVSLVPGGYEPLRRTIATMSVANLSDLADLSDYRIEATEQHNKLTGRPARSVTTQVLNHDRRQSVWVLVAKAAIAVADGGSRPDEA